MAGDPDSYLQHRRLLFSLAYRMLGSVQDAEDIVQDAYLRWQTAARDAVETPRAYLSTVVTRLCIDHLRAARTRREQYVGTWLPEPLITPDDGDATPAFTESLSMAFLLLLERLTPAERAVYLLREVFERDYREVAAIVGKREAACRQIAARARRHMTNRPARYPVTTAQRDALMAGFLEASRTGDASGLIRLLRAEVTLWSDGGGKVASARKPVHGLRAVSRLLAGVARRYFEPASFHATTVNGAPGSIRHVAGRIQRVFVVEMAPDGIHSIYIVANPDKLRGLGGDLGPACVDPQVIRTTSLADATREGADRARGVPVNRPAAG
ncbi:MAG: hypothetical protein B7Z66_03115 [Chromatiales bacterium 21-64-14]|nr:MAG: hypothetical protein B7Z66_03115 [Chromatiales bacterium 21-64-14]